MAAHLLHSRAATSQRGATNAASPASISLSDVLGALSHALDLTEGQPIGHTLRSCIIGMRLGEVVGLSSESRSALYYALLLKDAGCSSNASRMSQLFGSDDRLVKRRMKLVDWHHAMNLAVSAARNTAIGRSLPERVRHFFGIARTEGMTREIIQLRCERGSDIALQLGFPAETAEAISSLDEHWNGRGYPQGLSGTAIPILSRIANIAQTVEVFHTTRGVRRALRMVRARRGTWFDPVLADAVLAWENDTEWWQTVSAGHLAKALGAVEPTLYDRWVEDSALDEVARAFAEIIDAKSPFTFRHSSNVAQYASGIARQMGLDADAQLRLRRAGLLHDIGKVGVSNQILDKRGPLTDTERREVERHPEYTWQILSRIEAFSAFAWTASIHHEKLDGSGYPWKLQGGQIDRSARILGVADMYEALISDRPYRAGLTPSRALEIMDEDRGTKLCGETLDALRAYVEENQIPTEL